MYGVDAPATTVMVMNGQQGLSTMFVLDSRTAHGGKVRQQKQALIRTQHAHHHHRDHSTLLTFTQVALQEEEWGA